jgi:hypothetical protein
MKSAPVAVRVPEDWSALMAKRVKVREENQDRRTPQHPWWWEFHWDCLLYGSPLMMQEKMRANWKESTAIGERA